jgi:hypothetical protein
MKVHAEMISRQRDEEPGTEWVVYATWDAPVDRQGTHGWVFYNPKIAERLVAAINAQAVFTDPVIKTDTHGNTYVAATSRVLGKYANADLKRLGY